MNKWYNTGIDIGAVYGIKFTFSFFWEDCEWLHNLRSYPKYFFTSRFHENLELYLQWANKAKGMGAEISAQKLRVFDKMRVFTTEDTGSGYETLCAWIPLSHSIMSLKRIFNRT